MSIPSSPTGRALLRCLARSEFPCSGARRLSNSVTSSFSVAAHPSSPAGTSSSFASQLKPAQMARNRADSSCLQGASTLPRHRRRSSGRGQPEVSSSGRQASRRGAQPGPRAQASPLGDHQPPVDGRPVPSSPYDGAGGVRVAAASRRPIWTLSPHHHHPARCQRLPHLRAAKRPLRRHTCSHLRRQACLELSGILPVFAGSTWQAPFFHSIALACQARPPKRKHTRDGSADPGQRAMTGHSALLQSQGEHLVRKNMDRIRRGRDSGEHGRVASRRDARSSRLALQESHREAVLLADPRHELLDPDEVSEVKGMPLVVRRRSPGCVVPELVSEIADGRAERARGVVPARVAQERHGGMKRGILPGIVARWIDQDGGGRLDYSGIAPAVRIHGCAAGVHGVGGEEIVEEQDRPTQVGKRLRPNPRVPYSTTCPRQQRAPR